MRNMFRQQGRSSPRSSMTSFLLSPSDTRSLYSWYLCAMGLPQLKQRIGMIMLSVALLPLASGFSLSVWLACFFTSDVCYE